MYWNHRNTKLVTAPCWNRTAIAGFEIRTFQIDPDVCKMSEDGRHLQCVTAVLACILEIHIYYNQSAISCNNVFGTFAKQ